MSQCHKIIFLDKYFTEREEEERRKRDKRERDLLLDPM
jgi:hypothetical protein